MTATTYDVDLVEATYPVTVGPILSSLDKHIEAVYAGEKILIVIDDFIDKRYGAILYPSLAQKYDVTTHVIRGGKDSKTFSSVLEIFNVLEDGNFSRDSLLLGVGGGVVGDMAGFAASCWYRGMRLIHMPTTLLSAVDSCLGGKTAINLKSTVNAIGSYHHPISILIDTSIIRALPGREIRSGIGEIVKYAAISSEPIAKALEESSASEVLQNIDWFILESLKIKESFVLGDINEGNKRLHLNFGHTLGHAIEFGTILNGEETLRHGEAVALGMVAIFRISVSLGYLSEHKVQWLKGILNKFGLPISYSAKSINMEAKELLEVCMSLVVKDKKRLVDGLRLIILHDIRKPFIYKTNDLDLLEVGFREIIDE